MINAWRADVTYRKYMGNFGRWSQFSQVQFTFTRKIRTKNFYWLRQFMHYSYAATM